MASEGSDFEPPTNVTIVNDKGSSGPDSHRDKIIEVDEENKTDEASESHTRRADPQEAHKTPEI